MSNAGMLSPNMQAYAEHMKATRPRRHDISVSQSPGTHLNFQDSTWIATVTEITSLYAQKGGPKGAHEE